MANPLLLLYNERPYFFNNSVIYNFSTDAGFAGFRAVLHNFF